MLLLLSPCPDWLLGIQSHVSSQVACPHSMYMQHLTSSCLLAGSGMVDGVMTLSAAQALFYNQSALILSGLPNTTQYVTYPPMPKAGAVSQVRLSWSLQLISCLSW